LQKGFFCIAAKWKISDVNWHIKDDAPLYFVEVGGKKSKKRYRDYDLRGVN